MLGAITAGAWLGSRRLGSLAAAMAALVAFARVFAGVHYVSDVVVGFLIGVASATLVWVALTPATPVIERLDGALQARYLRPRPRAS